VPCSLLWNHRSSLLQYRISINSYTYSSNMVACIPSFLSTAALTCLLLSSALCHMQMSVPYPLHSPLDPQTPEADKDYSMTSPLLGDGSNFPCKGYQNDRPIRTTADYVAGKTYSMSLTGTATHGGGSCQLSLSYDNGKTFKVIKSIIGGCPLTVSFDWSFRVQPH